MAVGDGAPTLPLARSAQALVFVVVITAGFAQVVGPGCRREFEGLCEQRFFGSRLAHKVLTGGVCS